MSIRTKISVLFLLILGIAGSFFLKTEMNEIKRRYREATEEPLVDFATVLASVVASESSDSVIMSDKLKYALSKTSWAAPKAQIYNLEKSSTDIRIYITDNAGIVVFDSHNGEYQGRDHSNWQDVSRTLRAEYGARMSYTPEDGSSGRMYVTAAIISNNKIIGTLSVGKATTSANLFIAAAKKNTLRLGVGTFFSVLLMGVLLTFYVTSPIDLLINYVKRSAAGYNDPLPKLPSNEIAILGNEFEKMRTALDGRKYIENYVQTLTHEIKSPLSGIKAAAEILAEDPPEEDRKRFLNNISRESVRIENLIQNLLNLTSLQNRAALEEKEEIKVSELIDELLNNFLALSESKNIKFFKSIEAEPTIIGDRFWMAQAIGHLLHNAIEFSPAKSQISILSRSEKGKVIIEVKDHGAGIPDFAKSRIFEKFFSLPRPGSNKKSSGLGLALVNEIIKLHQGEVLIESELGVGTCMRLTLDSPN